MRNLVRRQHHDGFSAIELLAVLVIIGILARIGLPAFQGIRLGKALTSAQQHVAATVLRARWMAINRGQSRTVDLSSATSIQVTNGAATTFETLNLSSYFVTQSVLSPGGTTSIAFDARGIVTSPNTTPVQIRLTNPRNATLDVFVDKLGRIQTP